MHLCVSSCQSTPLAGTFFISYLNVTKHKHSFSVYDRVLTSICESLMLQGANPESVLNDIRPISSTDGTYLFIDIFIADTLF